MTPDEMERIAARLYGRTWRIPLAAALGVNRRTITRWSANSVPAWAADRILAMAPVPASDADLRALLAETEELLDALKRALAALRARIDGAD